MVKCGFQDTIRKLEDSFDSKEQGCDVLRKISNGLEDDVRKLTQQIQEYANKVMMLIFM